MRLIFYNILMVTLGVSQLVGQGLTPANQAFERGDYSAAISMYEELLLEQKISADLLYNLGNAYYKNGDIGKAILNYERSLKLEPQFEPAKKNIAFIKDQIEYPFSKIPDFFLKRWWYKLVSFLSISAWSWVHLFSLLLGLIGIYLWLFSKQVETKKWGFFGAIGGIFCSLLFFILADQRRLQQYESGEGIILENDIFLKTAPDQASPDLIELREGVKVFIDDELNEWYKVYLEDRESGWIQKDWIEVI